MSLLLVLGCGSDDAATAVQGGSGGTDTQSGAGANGGASGQAGAADACESNSADHCWFDKMNCFANEISLEPAWVEPDSTAAFALEANADWVAATVVRP
jgi:hypothetical protein